MRFAPHMLLGGAAGLTLAHLAYPDAQPWVLAAAAAVAAPLPDIDQCWSPDRPPYEPGGFALLNEHRGPTHSLLAAALLALGLSALGWVSESTIAAMSVGYVSHLVADYPNYVGQPLLFPWPRRYRLPYGLRFASSKHGVAEIAVGVVVLALVVHLTGVVTAAR